MAQYRVTENSFINGHFVAVGETVDYAGIPGFNLEPLDDEARAAKGKAGLLAQRNVNSRAFQEDLTRPDGTPPQQEDLLAEKTAGPSEATTDEQTPKTDEPDADGKASKKSSTKG